MSHNPVLTGHTLRRASADCHLCACGFAIFGAQNDSDATRRHGQHVSEVKRVLGKYKDAKGQQTTADFDQANGQHTAANSWQRGPVWTQGRK
jgi:hypothetical protein